MTRRILSSLLALAALTAALAACGGEEPSTAGDPVASVADDTAASTAASGDDASATSTDEQSREDAMLDFARCMREHGIQVDDPKDGALRVTGKKGQEKTMQAAQKACRTFLQAAGGEPSEADKARFREAALKFARCMREHGVDMPDPKGDGAFAFGPDQGLDPSDPKFQKAQKACGDGISVERTEDGENGTEGQ